MLNALRLHKPLRLILAYSMTLVCLIAFSGCYTLMGAEHNRVAVKELAPGMPLSKCIEELAAGGRVEVQWDWPVDSPEERESAIESTQALLALTDAESVTGRHAIRAQFIFRWWGFMGFGEVHLFLDAQNELVGYHLLHIN